MEEEPELTHWLYPANLKYYDVLGALAEPKTYWPMNSRAVPGDHIFIYLAAPHKRIAFKGEVLEIDLPQSAVLNAISGFFIGPPPTTPGKRNFLKIAMRESYPLDRDSGLGLEQLREHGLKGMLMGARKLENIPGLLAYILETAHDL